MITTDTFETIRRQGRRALLAALPIGFVLVRPPEVTVLRLGQVIELTGRHP